MRIIDQQWFEGKAAAIQAVSNDLHAAFAKLAEALRRYEEEDHPAFLEVLKRRGWVGMWDFGPAQNSYVVRLAKDKGDDAVDAYICNVYRYRRYEHIRRMLTRWWKAPYFAKRKKIILSAIRAHRRGEYALSIPTLLPLVDGFSAELFFESSGQRTRRSVVKETAKAAADDFWKDLTAAVVHSLIWKDYDLKMKRKPHRALNRHAILKGRVINYATEANSLRVILLLDMLCVLTTRKSKP